MPVLQYEPVESAVSAESAAIAAIGIALPVIATALVVARFAARRRSREGYGADDWSSVVCLVAVYFLNFMLVWGALRPDSGLLLTYQRVLNENVIEVAKITYASSLLWLFLIAAVKVSTYLLYIRLCKPSQASESHQSPESSSPPSSKQSSRDTFRDVLWAFIAVTILWAVAYIVVTLPGEYFDLANIAFISVDGFDVLLDVATLVLPAFFIWTLSSTLKRTLLMKLLIAGIFFIGFLSVGASIARLVYRVNYRLTLNCVDYDIFGRRCRPQKDWTPTQVYICTLLEVDLGLIAACLPALGGLLRSRDNSTDSVSPQPEAAPSRSVQRRRERPTINTSCEPSFDEKTSASTAVPTTPEITASPATPTIAELQTEKEVV